MDLVWDWGVTIPACPCRSLVQLTSSMKTSGKWLLVEMTVTSFPAETRVVKSTA